MKLLDVADVQCERATYRTERSKHIPLLKRHLQKKEKQKRLKKQKKNRVCRHESVVLVLLRV